ncbi:hypothetical protein WME73_10955 [Sorangium sp. So ce302]|uniref:hypothetical protein n=1 Tax=Sorangium sp. So ce302 TaxID=3133297 RepID=UPI003F5ED3CE
MLPRIERRDARAAEAEDVTAAHHLLLRVAVIVVATATAATAGARPPRPAPAAPQAHPPRAAPAASPVGPPRRAPAPSPGRPPRPSPAAPQALLPAPAAPQAPPASPALPALPSAASPEPAAWRALVVGGGPRPPMNQVAIEGHIRYFQSLLPARAERRVLFADGRRGTRSVQFLDGDQTRYRAPRLPRIDGATTRPGFDAIWRRFVHARPAAPLLLYFAGHGSPDPGHDLDNNVFDLWGGGALSVRDLAARMKELPDGTPVVLVMAQCYSGSFANLLFEGGRPDGELVERDIVGFFAATRDRPASGCTPEIDEADYTDFSSFFFAALSGVDRLGKRVDGADYDRNQLVGMNEAFAYALLHQETGDVPVATSDVFLRRFVNKPDHETMATPYSRVLSWSTPAERAALEGLSDALGLHGEHRLRAAYDREFGPRAGRRDVEDVDSAHRLRFIRLAKSVVLARTLRQSGNRARIERFERLRAAEARNPLVEVRAASLARQDGRRRAAR